MGKIKKHPPVKLIVGFIFNQEDTLNKAEVLLEKKFGKIDFESQIMHFVHTDYYEQEFGKGLKRKFVSFKKLIFPQRLSSIKLITNKIEQKLSLDNRRQINIDPGYLDFSKLVLATTKDYKHRVYLNKGIFAEVTLYYQDKTFKSWDWTYPDYKTSDYREIFNKIRQIYVQQIR